MLPLHSTTSTARIAEPQADSPRDVAGAVAALLEELGVVGCYGLTGGALAKLADALGRTSFPLVHFRHESGAAFAALEASLATGKPAAVFATTGPGITNALTGLLAARGEGAKVILVSAATPAQTRGRGAVQETGGHVLPAEFFHAGTIFHYAEMIEHPAQLEVAAARLRTAMQRPGAFVAHLAIPSNVQGMPAVQVPRALLTVTDQAPSAQAIAIAGAQLREGPFVIWAGYGAVHFADQVRALAERTGAPVMCSPRAKGLFPERHPLYLGVTGLGGHDEVDRYFAHKRPARVLVLGTRLGEPTSYWSPALVPSRGFVHVDVDPSAHGVAYPNVPTLAVTADIGAFLEALTPALPPQPWDASRALGPAWRPVAPAPRTTPEPVRAAVLMDAVQRKVVDATEAVVMSEAGNAFAWANHLLRFDAPRRYRVSVGFGSMAHATAGVVGAALARKAKAVALVGDGSMLMLSEVSTAVRTGAQAVWVVLNDARYAMVEEGMKALGLTPVETDIPEVDFTLVAKGLGCDAVRVESESELDQALELAMRSERPFVVDVRMDATEAGPWLKRIQALIAQGQQAKERQA